MFVLVKPMPGNAWAPSLAESWTASKDGLTYGASTLKAHVAALEIVDAQRVRFRMKQPWPDFMTF